MSSQLDVVRRVDSVILDAVGPQAPTFRELVEAVKAAVGLDRHFRRAPRSFALAQP